MSEFFKKIVAFFTAIFAFIASLFGVNPEPSKKTDLDLSKFELVWSDEFDGNSIDSTKWEIQRKTSVIRGGYWNTDLAQVKDGELTIYAKYLENGVNEGDPAGWYSARLRTKDRYEPTYGYYEIRCKVPKGYGLWSAFWMQNLESAMNEYEDSSKGSEIDIFEAPYYGKENPNSIQNAIHWGGYAEKHKSLATGPIAVDADIYNTYNTYGLEWNENEYIFYFNGMIINRWDKEDLSPSQATEFLILTIEMNGANGVPQNGWAVGTVEDNGRDFVGEFNIDYVRHYQYK